MTQRIAPGPGQESVWDYPRPPRVEAVSRRVRVIFHNVTIADSTRTYRVLETSHPPVYCIPQADTRMDLLSLVPHYQTYCEFKGRADYWDMRVGERSVPKVAWSYPQPAAGYEVIRDYLSFYASRVDACFLDDQPVLAQAGDFYGGWITSDVVGPFKGGPGTFGW